MAITGIFWSLDLSRNIRNMQIHVRPRVRTLKLLKVSVMIYKGLVRGDSSEARKKACMFSIARGKN